MPAATALVPASAQQQPHTRDISVAAPLVPRHARSSHACQAGCAINTLTCRLRCCIRCRAAVFGQQLRAHLQRRAPHRAGATPAAAAAPAAAAGVAVTSAVARTGITAAAGAAAAGAAAAGAAAARAASAAAWPHQQPVAPPVARPAPREQHAGAGVVDSHRVALPHKGLALRAPPVCVRGGGQRVLLDRREAGRRTGRRSPVCLDTHTHTHTRTCTAVTAACLNSGCDTKFPMSLPLRWMVTVPSGTLRRATRRSSSSVLRSTCMAPTCTCACGRVSACGCWAVPGRR
jgi:hypothetical protein